MTKLITCTSRPRPTTPHHIVLMKARFGLSWPLSDGKNRLEKHPIVRNPAGCWQGGCQPPSTSRPCSEVASLAVQGCFHKRGVSAGCF